MTPKRIVHLTTFLQGGAGRAIADLACAQHDAGHDVVVFTSATDEPGYGNYPAYLGRLSAAGVPVVVQDSLFKRDAALNDQVLERLSARCAPDAVDVVHAHAAVPAAIGLRFAARAEGNCSPVWRGPCQVRAGAPDPGSPTRLARWGGVARPTCEPEAPRRPVVIQTQHGWGTSKSLAQARHDLDVLNAVDRVIVTSNATGDFLAASGVPRDRLVTIPCGLSPDIPSIAQEAADIGRTLRREGGFILGCVGSVNDNKNQRLVVRALAEHIDRSVRAVFIGEGGHVLEAIASELGVSNRVHALGYHDDAERWMELFDALIVPSRSEGQGLVVLEAFRAGVPVLASNIPALRELVCDYETGWLFESDDARSLADAIERAASAAEDVRGRIIETASKLFLDRYTIDLMVARHEALYDELLSAATQRTPA